MGRRVLIRTLRTTNGAVAVRDLIRAHSRQMPARGALTHQVVRRVRVGQRVDQVRGVGGTVAGVEGDSNKQDVVVDPTVEVQAR